MLELVRLAKRFEIVLDPLDRVARRLAALRQFTVGEFGDRRPDVVDRARADVLLDLVEFRLALAEDVGVDRPALGVHPHRFVEQSAGADVVPADDEILPIDQIERLKPRQRGDQPGVADQALFQGDQAGQSGGGDASLRADEPKSDAGTGMISKETPRISQAARAEAGGKGSLNGQPSSRLATGSTQSAPWKRTRQQTIIVRPTGRSVKRPAKH